METVDYILSQLKKLTAIPSPSGYTTTVSKYVIAELKRLGYAPEMTQKGGVLCTLGGASQNASLLTGHIDTLGGMVCSIKSNGRLRISPIGGLSPNNAEAENCTIITRDGNSYSGTFQLDNASVHVNGEYGKEAREFKKMEVVIDEDVKTADDTRALGIEVGDYVCFDPRTVITKSGYIKSRFLDDKLSVAILLGFAKDIKEEKLKLNQKTYIHITVYEEVGHGGCGSIPEDVTEILAIDMGCVGDELTCSERQVSICAKDSAGPSNYDFTTKLIELAKKNSIDYAVDVYPFYGSDADAALRSGYDVRHCLIGAGVYASHGYERSHIDGIKNTLALIKAYSTR